MILLVRVYISCWYNLEFFYCCYFYVILFFPKPPILDKLLWRSKHGQTDRTDMLPRRFTHHKCCWNNAALTFRHNALRGKWLFFFTFQMLRTHIENVSLVFDWPWKCFLDAYTACSVRYHPSTPNGGVWFVARSPSMGCSPNENGISGSTGSPHISPKIHRELITAHFALRFFSVSLSVSLGSFCSHHIIVKHSKAYNITGICTCTY